MLPRLFPVDLTLVALLALGGCATSRPGPEQAAHSYAQALREGRLDDAQALLASRPDAPSKAELARRYPDEASRNARAEEIEGSLDELTTRRGALVLVDEKDGWRVVEPSVEIGARKALEAFITAAEAGDFTAAWKLLSGELRARYTPERLQQDFEVEPLARERLARARAALAQEPVIQGETAAFPVGEGRSVRLRREEGSYRVASLE